MTKYEAAVVSAYTGILIGEFSDLHEFIELVLARPVYTHELASKDTMSEIKAKTKQHFMNLNVK